MQLYCQNSFPFVFKQLITSRMAGSFPSPPFFPLAEFFFSLSPIFNVFQAITVSPKVEEEDSQ